MSLASQKRRIAALKQRLIDFLGGNTLEVFGERSRTLRQELFDPDTRPYSLSVSCMVYSSFAAQIALGRYLATGERPFPLLQEAWIISLASDRFREIATYERAKQFRTFSEWAEKRLSVNLQDVNVTMDRSAGLFLLDELSEVERASQYLMINVARRDYEYWRRDADYSSFLEAGPKFVAALTGAGRSTALTQIKDVEPFSYLWVEGVDDERCEDVLRALCDWHLAALARSWKRSLPVYYLPDSAAFPTWIFALAKLRFARDAPTLGDIHPLLDIGRDVLSGYTPGHDSELVRAIEATFAKRFPIGPQELLSFWKSFRDT